MRRALAELDLAQQGARSLFAEIHPDHGASMNVARHLGLKPGDEILESGETRWSEQPTGKQDP